MTFAPVSFSPSGTVAGLADGVAEAVSAVSQGLQQGVAGLADLGLTLPDPGDLGGMMQNVRDQAQKALSTPAGFMAIAPTQHTIGTKAGDYSYLTPQQALGTLAKRLGDVPQKKDEKNALFVLVVASQTLAGAASSLQAFNRIYPLEDLQKLQRRMASLAALETEKFVIPKGAGFPAWGTTCPAQEKKGQAMAQGVGSLLAAGEASALAEQSPLAMLGSFAQKQVAALAKKAEEVQQLLQGMAGSLDGWLGLYLEGDAVTIARELAKIAPPLDDSFKSTTLLCWYGTPDQVRYYKESFGYAAS